MGNIQTFAAKGMRLPTLYETNAEVVPGYNSLLKTPITSNGTSTTAFAGDGALVFAGNRGVPAGNTGATWTATSDSSDVNNYWGGQSPMTAFTLTYTWSYNNRGIRCVLP
jgi:hypothetical protein